MSLVTCTHRIALALPGCLFLLMMGSLACKGPALDCYQDTHCSKDELCNTQSFLCVPEEQCPIYYLDKDGDGWGSDELGRHCIPPNTPKAVTQGGDCDDNDPKIHPGATEIPYNCKDDDCNPDTPDDDLDGDGFPIADCPYNYDVYPNFEGIFDCDDEDPDRFPGNDDLCPGNGIDNDCDGIADNGPNCLVSISGGDYVIGRHETGKPWSPPRTISLSPFTIATYEVNNRQVDASVQRGEMSADLHQRPHPHGYPENYPTADLWKRHPAVGLSHSEAQAYCQARGGRLPTEAEWEVAARGASERIHPWGTENIDCARANYNRCERDSNPQRGPVAVDALPLGCTPSGICGLAGNVMEWVQDWYSASYYASLPEHPEEPAENPSGPDSGVSRVVRGGSWLSSDHELTAYYRVGRPSVRTEDIGFRCVYPIP